MRLFIVKNTFLAEGYGYNGEIDLLKGQCFIVEQPEELPRPSHGLYENDKNWIKDYNDYYTEYKLMIQKEDSGNE